MVPTRSLVLNDVLKSSSPATPIAAIEGPPLGRLYVTIWSQAMRTTSPSAGTRPLSQVAGSPNLPLCLLVIVGLRAKLGTVSFGPTREDPEATQCGGVKRVTIGPGADSGVYATTMLPEFLGPAIEPNAMGT